MCNNHTLCAFFNDRPEIPHPSIFIRYIILYQVVWNTAQLIHAAVTWNLNEQSWLMNLPCSTKINNHHIPHWTFQELYKAKVAIYLPGWRMNEPKSETYCWYSIGLHPRWNIFFKKPVQKENTLTQASSIFLPCLTRDRVDGCI